MLPPNSLPFSISTLVEEEHQHDEPHTRHPGDMWCSQETTELYTMNTEAFTELQACKSFFFQEKGAMRLHHTHISILCLIWCLALCKSWQVTPLLDLAMLPARAVVVLLLTVLQSPGFPSNSSSSLTHVYAISDPTQTGFQMCLYVLGLLGSSLATTCPAHGALSRDSTGVFNKARLFYGGLQLFYTKVFNHHSTFSSTHNSMQLPEFTIFVL